MTFDALALFAMVGAVVGAWWAGLLPPHYTARPLWLGFTATAASTLFLVAGLIGYKLNSDARFLTGTAWADGVIWWELAIGLS